MKGFGSTKPRSNNDKVKLEDLIDFHKLEPEEWTRVRFIGPITSFVRFWIPIIPKEGAKPTSIPKFCVDYNPETDEFDGDTCPYRKSGLFRAEKKYIVNAIIRDLEGSEPKNAPDHTKSERKLGRPVEYDDYEAHIKEKGSKSWTPVRAIMIPSSIAEKLKKFIDLNTKKDKKTGKVTKKELSDPKYGIDINLLYNGPKAPANAMYDAQKEERTPLSEEELAYLLQKLDVAKPETPEEAATQWKDLKGKLDHDKIEKENAQRNKGKGKSKKDAYIDDEDEDEDEDEKPKKKKKKHREEDDVDDDDDAFDPDEIEAGDDDDDDDAPSMSSKKKKKKKKKKGLGKKKRRDDDDNDDDED